MSDRRTALLIVDMISDWSFADAERLVEPALEAAPAIERLRQRCHAAGLPVLYANDHHGDWKTDFAGVVARSLKAKPPGCHITEMLRPADEDYFILKPRHSAFHATPLEIVLEHLGVTRLVLTGVSTDQCVYMTAADARTRQIDVWVPRDAVASQTPRRAEMALEMMEQALQYRTEPSTREDVVADYLGDAERDAR